MTNGPEQPKPQSSFQEQVLAALNSNKQKDQHKVVNNSKVRVPKNLSKGKKNFQRRSH